MTFKDINRRFTEIVSEYMAKGYTLNAATMSGSQGELAAVDLTDGSEIIRVYVDRFNDREHFSLQGIQIVVGRDTDGCEPNGSSNWATVWNNHLEEIEVEQYYLMGERCNHEWYGTQEEAYAAFQKRIDRYSAREDDSKENIIDSEKAVEIVLPAIRRKYGITRVDRKKVQISKMVNRSGKHFYWIEYGNKKGFGLF